MHVSNATKACALYEEERGEDGRIVGLRKTEEYSMDYAIEGYYPVLEKKDKEKE